MAGISITLAGNFSKLDDLKAKSKKTADSIKASFKDGLAGKAFVGLSATAAAAFAVVVASVKSAIDAGGELQDMMTKTGASGKELLVLGQAFKNAGLAAGDVGGAIGRLQKAMEGLNEDGEPTNEAFGKLKLNLDELIAMDPAAALRKVGAALAGVEDPAQRTAAAMQIFGKSGANLLAVFADSGALEQARTQLGGLADTLPANAAAFDAFGDALGAIDVKMTQLGAGLAAELLPNLQEAADGINNLDLTDLGTGLGMIINQFREWAEALGPVADYLKFISGIRAMNWLAEKGFGGAVDPEKARKMAEEWAKNDPNHMKSGQQIETKKKEKVEKFKGGPGMPKGGTGMTQVSADGSSLREAIVAAQKLAAEKAKSRAAALSEYNMESQILSAKLKGDAAKLAALEREKAIREEIKRLEGAGFTAAEAAGPAAAKVDAEKKAEALEAQRKTEAEAAKNKIDGLAGRIQDVRGRQAGQQFQSSLGAVSSMQSIGGGGGAVSSGLDYARQTNDLQREANDILRQIAAMSAGTLDK